MEAKPPKNEGIFPLDKIILGVSSDEAYEWLQSQSFTTGLLVLVCQHKIMASKGNRLEVPHSTLFSNDPKYCDSVWDDTLILDCLPLSKGYITVTTEILITKVHVKRQKAQSPIQPEVPQTIMPAMMSDFLVRANDPRCNLPKQRGAHIEPESGENNAASFTEVQVCLVTEFNAFLEFCSKLDASDLYNSVVVNKNTAYALGFFSNSYAEIKCSSQKSDLTALSLFGTDVQKTSASNRNANKRRQKPKEKKDKERHPKVPRIVQVLVDREGILCKDDANKREIMMLPSLWFHIKYRGVGANGDVAMECLIRKKVYSRQDGLSSSGSWLCAPPYATEVHISCVVSPNYSAGANYASVLQQYFEKPRIIHKGDVLCINMKDDPEFHQDLTEGALTRCPLVFFRVTEVIPKRSGRPAFVADVNHTTMLQEGTLNSFVPLTMEVCVSRPEEINRITGLESYFSKCVQLILPYIRTKSQCEELYPSILLTGPAGCGKSLICAVVARHVNMHYYKVNCYELCGETSAATEARIKHVFQKGVMFAPCILQLEKFDSLGRDRDGHAEDPRVASSFYKMVNSLQSDSPKWPVIVIATTTSPRQLTSDMNEGFLHHVHVEVPDEVSRADIVSSLLESEPCSSDVSVGYIAQRTAGMVLGDLQALLSMAKAHAHNRLSLLVSSSYNNVRPSGEEALCEAGVLLQHKDFTAALDTMQAAHSDSIGAPKIPNVSWQDVGGLANVKREILDTIQLPLQHPELLAAGLRRSGVLLYGPPGTGKTLLAKAVATECSLNFLSVKGPELLNMYVGQSEENVRDVFERARSATPCVVFFDELDSLAPNRGRSGDSGGVMDRVVSQLLAELDGLNKSSDVFIIGATNRPDLLDPALLRPGRFDKLLYLGVSEDKESQLKIVKALTRKFHLAKECSLERVVEKCASNMTGADFYALCSDAMLNSIKRRIALLDAGGNEKTTREGKAEPEGEEDLRVEERDFLEALASLVPSVSIQELQHYKALQHAFLQQK